MKPILHAVLAALIASTVAGCVGGNAGSESTDQTKEAAGPAEFDDTTGGVEGVVTDDQISPIAGATVGFTDLADVTGTTDAAGRFSLSKVPPGAHTLVVQKLGYESAGKKVEVFAGQVLGGLQMILVPLAVDEPHPELLIHKGIIKNGVGIILTATCQNCGSAETFYKFKGGLPDDMSALMIEATWGTRDFLGIDLVDRNVQGGIYWRIRAHSPIHYLVDRCGEYLDPPFYASKQVPCEPEDFDGNAIQAETWYVGDFQDETHNLDPVCRAGPLPYKAGCYGAGFVAELVFTDYYTIFHGERPLDIDTYSAMPDG